MPRDSRACRMPSYGVGGQLAQCGVQRRRVLPFQQPHAPVFVGQAHPQLRRFLSDDCRRFLLVDGVHRREHPGHRRRPHSFAAHISHGPPQFVPIQGRDFPPVELVAAAHHVGEPAQRRLQLGRPVHHGRQQLRRRQGQPHHRRRAEVAPFQQGVGKVGGAYHHGVHRPAGRQPAQQVGQGVDDARSNVAGGGQLDGVHQPAAVHQHGVRVGAAHVNANEQVLTPYTRQGSVVHVVAKGPRPGHGQPLRGSPQLRRREPQDGNSQAIPHHLGGDGFAQVGGHGAD